MKTPTITMAAALACGVLSAQEKKTPPDNDVNLPVPIASPFALRPGTVDPLTPEQKVSRAIRNTIAPRSIVNRLLLSGYAHATDNPEEWSGNLDGFGQRFASLMGRLAVRQGVQLSTDLIFGLDPRYDRCNCTGFKARTKHAWKRVFVARTDRGTDYPAISNFAGAFIPPMITMEWHPPSDNTWSNKFQSGGEFLALRGATNMLREFWPDISRTIRRKRTR